MNEFKRCISFKHFQGKVLDFIFIRGIYICTLTHGMTLGKTDFLSPSLVSLFSSNWSK